MKPGKLAALAYACALLIIFAGACTSNPGIEVGNPDLKGKTYTLEVDDSDTAYVVQIVDESTAVVSQEIADSFETVSVPYLLEDNEISLDAAFSDGTQVAVVLILDDDANLLEAELTINGNHAPTHFQVEDAGTTVEPEIALASLGTALCERIVSCNTGFEQAACESSVMEVSGLSREFGNAGNQSLNEAEQAVEQGDLLIDGDALQACLAGVEVISCDSVQKYFIDGEAADYGQTRKLVPKPVCSNGVLRDHPNGQNAH